MRAYDFRAVNYPVRLYSGQDAIANIKAESARNRGKRAFILCGRTVARKTALIERLREHLGELCAGVYDEMEKDSPLGPILMARDAVRAQEADALIAVGGGSVIQAERVVAILLAEKGDPHELCTQYPEGRPAQSVKLLQPKLPLINVCTTPTSAMNRAGSGVKDANADHRLEFFDPKTRPKAVYWDAQALLTAPVPLARGLVYEMIEPAFLLRRPLGIKFKRPTCAFDRLLSRHPFSVRCDAKARQRKSGRRTACHQISFRDRFSRPVGLCPIERQTGYRMRLVPQVLKRTT